MDPEKISIIVRWHRPTLGHEVRQFLGFCGYYRRYVRNYSKIATSLHELTRRNEKFEWTEERDQAFETLKKKIVTAPILAMSQDSQDFTLDVDASNWAVEAVLPQEQDGLLRVISYASKTFRAAEQRYCITRKELAGMMFGLKHYRQYLLGRKFSICTDHATLSYLLTAKDLIGQQARWVDLMSEYTFTIQHRAGKSHSNADALSRILPCEENSDPCKQCLKHIREVFHENTETGEETVEYARVRVLRVSAGDDTDNEAEDTDDHAADTEPVLIDLRDPCSSSSSLSCEITSPPTVEEFIVLDDSEDQSYIQCSQISTKRIYVQPPRNKMIMSPIIDVSIILPPVIHLPYVPHEDFRPNSPLSNQSDPPPDAERGNTDTALRFAENIQYFYMSEQADSGGSEGAENMDTGSVHGSQAPARTTEMDVSNNRSITTSPLDANSAAPLPTSSPDNAIQLPYHMIDCSTVRHPSFSTVRHMCKHLTQHNG